MSCLMMVWILFGVGCRIFGSGCLVSWDIYLFWIFLMFVWWIGCGRDCFCLVMV